MFDKMEEKAKSFIGKYIAYEENNVCVFAKVIDYKINKNCINNVIWLIAKDYRTCVRCSVLKNYNRVMIRLDKILKIKNFRVIDIMDKKLINDINDELFLELLSCDSKYVSALSLGADLLPVDKKLIEKIISVRNRGKNLFNL